jgi:hypothetical protein
MMLRVGIALATLILAIIAGNAWDLHDKLRARWSRRK